MIFPKNGASFGSLFLNWIPIFAFGSNTRLGFVGSDTTLDNMKHVGVCEVLWFLCGKWNSRVLRGVERDRRELWFSVCFSVFILGFDFKNLL